MQDKSVKNFFNSFRKCQKIRIIPQKSVKSVNKLGNTKNCFASVKKIRGVKKLGKSKSMYCRHFTQLKIFLHTFKPFKTVHF